MSTNLYPKFIVMTASAQVSGKARRFGHYRRVAVVSLRDEFRSSAFIPKMISERAIGIEKIIRDYGACSVGTTDHCEYNRMLEEAKILTNNLNKGVEI